MVFSHSLFWCRHSARLHVCHFGGSSRHSLPNARCLWLPAFARDGSERVHGEHHTFMTETKADTKKKKQKTRNNSVGGRLENSKQSNRAFMCFPPAFRTCRRHSSLLCVCVCVVAQEKSARNIEHCESNSATRNDDNPKQTRNYNAWPCTRVKCCSRQRQIDMNMKRLSW